MTQQASGRSSKRNVFIGIGVAAVAALVAGKYVFDIPPSGDGASGTVAPAERYSAPQVKADDVKLGDQSITKLLQDDKVERAIKDPAFQPLAANPQVVSAMAANPKAFEAMASNPQAFQAALANPKAFQAMASNPQAFSALAANPAAVQAIMAQPQVFSAIAASPKAFS